MRIHRLFTSYWAKSCLYLILILEVTLWISSEEIHSLYYMINWQIFKKSIIFLKWFFIWLIQPMITSPDFKTSFYPDEICPSCQYPPNSMKPKSEQNVPIVLVTWPALLCSVHCTSANVAKVFWSLLVNIHSPRAPRSFPHEFFSRHNFSNLYFHNLYFFSLHVEHLLFSIKFHLLFNSRK